jgi:precorrin-6A/cobalt-precorrin-6A reductase
VILILGGTTEARELARYLQEEGFPLCLTTVSAHGAQLARNHGVGNVQQGALNREDLISLIRKENVKVIIDATHPYAENIRLLAQSTAQELGITYGRFERAASPLPEHPLLYKVDSYRAGAEQAGFLGDNIFLTVGSRRLAFFTKCPVLAGKKLTARVLPEAEVLELCHELGFGPGNIVAAQGPFSREANRWMFNHYGAQVVVSKESGPTGGFLAKWEACLDLKLPLVVIQRPAVIHPNSFDRLERVKKFVEEVSRNG